MRFTSHRLSSSSLRRFSVSIEDGWQRGMTDIDASQAPTILQTLITLLPVVVGGVIALASGVTTGILNHLFKRRSDRKERRRKKLEEFVALTYEVETWLDGIQRSYTWGGEEINEFSPIHNMRSICTTRAGATVTPMTCSAARWIGALN
jgi:hypothetical protein